MSEPIFLFSPSYRVSNFSPEIEKLAGKSIMFLICLINLKNKLQCFLC